MFQGYMNRYANIGREYSINYLKYLYHCDSSLGIMSNKEVEHDEIKDETHELQDDESDIEEEEDEEDESNDLEDIDFDEIEEEVEEEKSDGQDNPDDGS